MFLLEHFLRRFKRKIKKLTLFLHLFLKRVTLLNVVPTKQIKKLKDFVDSELNTCYIIKVAKKHGRQNDEEI